MTLVNRVSAFFLAALAIALAGYSLAVYLIVSNYLYRQFDDGLHNALRILTASVEVEPDDAKWQPAEFNIEFDQATLRDVRWIVTDDRGQIVDHSPQISRNDGPFAAVLGYAHAEHPASDVAESVGNWRVLQRQLNAPQPKAIEIREPHEYAGVRITVARSPDELHVTLRRLALLLLAVPAALWLIAAAGGRLFVRQALAPLRAMADRARSMQHADFGLRLPVASTSDELADLGTAFNHLLDELQQSYEREKRFTGEAAHQLRTPLTVLQGQIDVALRRPRSSEAHEQTLKTLSDQVVEFRQIVESLLFLARAEEDAIAPDRERVELSTWLEQYLHRWDSHARRADLRLHAVSTTSVMISSPLLAQLLDNLVSNAFKYSQPGTHVTLQSIVAGQEIALSISDQGIGITAADQATLFDAFFRTADARRAGIAGTGLGLAVAKRIATALGGTLECRSEVNQGSTFTLKIPRNSAI